MTNGQPLTLKEKIALRKPGIVERPAKSHSDADPKCKQCGGFGWEQAPQYDNHWFICHCVIESHNKFLKALEPQWKPEYIGLTQDELSLTWDKVKPDISDGLKAVEAVKPAYEKGYGMIFLWGTYGQAKTLIGKILTATAYRDGKKSMYANMTSILDDIRLSFDSNNQSTELIRRVDWWTSRDVLFLDELDKTKQTDWAYERMFQLLDRCYTNAIRQQTLTVIASNSSDKELDGYLKSRLEDKRLGPVIHLNGQDGRKFMPEQYKF